MPLNGPKDGDGSKSETIWMNDSRPAVDRVRDWLGKGGHPLEFRVAAALEKAGYRANQGLYAEQKDGDPLEIDVVGVRGLEEKTGPAGLFELIVECKKAPTPWIVFVSGNEWSTPWFDDLGTESAAFAFNRMKTSPPPSLYGPKGRFGFGVKALKKESNDRDLAYAAVTGVIARALLRSAALSESTRPYLVIMRPVVVVEGAICAAYWDEKRGEVAVEELEWTRLRLRANRLTIVDLVTEDALPSYFDFIAEGVAQVLQILKRPLIPPHPKPGATKADT